MREGFGEWMLSLRPLDKRWMALRLILLSPKAPVT